MIWRSIVTPIHLAHPLVRGCLLSIHLKRASWGSAWECPLTSFSLSRFARIAFRCRPYVLVVGCTPLVLSVFTPPLVVGRITPLIPSGDEASQR